MKKVIGKGLVFGAVFFLALVIFSKIVNKGTTDMTTQMAGASFPVMYMQLGEFTYNELHGYAQPMEIAYMRENITLLGEDRSLNFAVAKFDSEISALSFEVRSVDGSRLIENTAVTEYRDSGRQITGRIVLKDLIEPGREYGLIFLVELEDGQTVRYYTRALWSTDCYGPEKLAYVLDFHEKTFDKKKAQELTKYLETNSGGDNTTLHRVDIHSSLNQVTWADLDVERVTEPRASIKEIARETASIRVQYIVSRQEGDQSQYYQVDEFYRIRYTKDRTYLLDFQREMTRFFDETGEVYVNDKIVLGIAGEDVPFVESEDGNHFVFVVQGKLCSYNVTDNKLTVLFSFYDRDNPDVRTLHQEHDFKILEVDEAGNVQFAVYGYMNRGKHEGQVGIQLYAYDSMRNTVEELLYIPWLRSPGILKKELDQLLYLNPENHLYFTLNENVYDVNLDEKTCSTVMGRRHTGLFQVSGGQQTLVWQTGKDPYASQEMILMDLSSRRQNRITAPEGEYLMPLGFMGEDLIYGYARAEDVTEDETGRVIFPMYKLFILGTDGTVHLQYSQQNIYVVGCTIGENQIVLERCVKSENGGYQETTPDQIMNNREESTGKNTIVTAVTELYQKVVQIKVKKEINAKGIQRLTPMEVLFEGDRQLELEMESIPGRYYVYGPQGVQGICSGPGEAVALAYELSGVVLDHRGEYVWIRGNRVVKNQIMAISADKAETDRSSMAVCLDTILKFEGKAVDTQQLLNQDLSVYEILENYLPDAQILDLKGCSLDAILYYANRDLPVLATLKNGDAVLVVGFNQYNIVVLNPVSGKLEMMGLNDSAAWFEESGNCFITYMK